MGKINELLGKIGTPPNEESFKGSQKDLRDLVDRLSKIDLHYLRKENQLFPLLEAHNISGPSQVMWAIHDDIRALIKKAQDQVSQLKSSETVATLKDLLAAIRDMIYKEEHILYPMSLERLTEYDWTRVKKGEEEIGYAWIKLDGEWPQRAEVEEEGSSEAGKFHLDTGYLSRDQINLMLTHLPVDLTLVDENDRVLYYSQGKDRIFPRSPGIIDREVQKCHPSKSVHIVNKILDEFKAGKRDVAEFWIQVSGRLIYIRYFAIRSPDGAYKGCLEVSQDVTGIRQLEGERRLLEWE